MADAPDLGSGTERREGSSPFSCTSWRRDGIGIQTVLKIPYLRDYGFDPRRRHHGLMTQR